jgi:hypothetical protein
VSVANQSGKLRQRVSWHFHKLTMCRLRLSDESMMALG